MLPLGNSSRPRPDTVASKTNVLKVKSQGINEHNEGYIRRDIPKPVDVSLLQQIKTLQFKKKKIALEIYVSRRVNINSLSFIYKTFQPTNCT